MYLVLAILFYFPVYSAGLLKEPFHYLNDQPNLTIITKKLPPLKVSDRSFFVPLVAENLITARFEIVPDIACSLNNMLLSHQYSTVSSFVLGQQISGFWRLENGTCLLAYGKTLELVNIKDGKMEKISSKNFTIFQDLQVLFFLQHQNKGLYFASAKEVIEISISNGIVIQNSVILQNSISCLEKKDNKIIICVNNTAHQLTTGLVLGQKVSKQESFKYIDGMSQSQIWMSQFILLQTSKIDGFYYFQVSSLVTKQYYLVQITDQKEVNVIIKIPQPGQLILVRDHILYSSKNSFMFFQRQLNNRIARNPLNYIFNKNSINRIHLLDSKSDLYVGTNGKNVTTFRLTPKIKMIQCAIKNISRAQYRFKVYQLLSTCDASKPRIKQHCSAQTQITIIHIQSFAARLQHMVALFCAALVLFAIILSCQKIYSMKYSKFQETRKKWMQKLSGSIKKHGRGKEENLAAQIQMQQKKQEIDLQN